MSDVSVDMSDVSEAFHGCQPFNWTIWLCKNKETERVGLKYDIVQEGFLQGQQIVGPSRVRVPAMWPL